MVKNYHLNGDISEWDVGHVTNMSYNYPTPKEHKSVAQSFM